MSNPASEFTLRSLDVNIRDLMEEVSMTLPVLIGAGRADCTRVHTVDLLLGSHYVNLELYSLCRNLLRTSSVYEKRFCMEWMNQRFTEGCSYFCGEDRDRSGGGVWLVVKQKILQLRNPIVDSYVQAIDASLEMISEKYCDRLSRNVTSHFDSPEAKMRLHLSLSDEDFFVRGLSQFMSLNMRISQLCTILAALVSQHVPSGTETAAGKGTEEGVARNPRLSLFNDLLAKTCQENGFLLKMLDLNIAQTDRLLPGLWNQRQLSGKIPFLLTLLFFRGDLACAVKAYLLSETEIERAFHLRRVYLVETAFMTKIFGYSDFRRQRSLWADMKRLGILKEDAEMLEIETELESVTEDFDRELRNLHTHYRYGERLNIVAQYESFCLLDHRQELIRCERLVRLCTKMVNKIAKF